MKNFFKAIGKALVYFLVYFVTQILASTIYTVIRSFKLGMELAASGETYDAAAVTATLTEDVMASAMTLTMISGIAALVIYWIVAFIRKKNLLEQLNVKKIPVIGLLPIAMVAAGMNLIVSVGMSMIPFPQSWVDSYAQSSSVIGDGNMVLAWIATVLVAPVVEEVVFRGYVYSRLKEGMAMVIATLLTSLLFAVVHGTIIWGIYTFIFSIVLIWTYEKYQSLTANIILHMVFNLTGMILSSITSESTALYVVLFIAGVAAFAAGMFWNYQLTKNNTKAVTAGQAPDAINL